MAVLTEDIVAEMQMSLVRVCRMERNAHGVWYRMGQLFPEFSREQIREAVKPVIERMMASIKE